MSNKVFKESCIVRPAAKTPTRTLWLSSLDLTEAGCHICSIYIYHPKNIDNDSTFFDTTIIKNSLSKALAAFYPLAGRLKEGSNGRLEIDCNAEGALFIEAETTHALDDFGDFVPTTRLKSLLDPSYDCQEDPQLLPLLMVQLTRFSCGGVALAVSQHHRVHDGYSGSQFINSWAKIARGLELDFVPFHDRTPYLTPRDPPQVKFRHLEYDIPKTFSGFSEQNENLDKEVTAITSMFKITKDQINALKQIASEVNYNRKFSTFEVLAGHILRMACKARGLADDQEVRLYIPVNGRNKLKNPALPQGFFGNVIFRSIYIAKSGDIIGNPLGYVAGKIHETLETMANGEYFRSAIDYLETHSNIRTLFSSGQVFRCPNLLINSWLRFPFYEADFGWGKPFLAGRGGSNVEGIAILAPDSNSDDGVMLRIELFPQHMNLFQKYLYDF